jgi:hypothetical protein
MHGYHEQHGRLPPAVVYGEDGKPLLSWRVLLLPFIEQKELYERFHLNEPWDSPHNLGLLAEMPRVFRPYDGSSSPEPNTTFYQVFVGKGTAFEDGALVRLEDIGRRGGTSNTFLIVEAGQAVPWTKPEDIRYAEDQPVPKLGGMFKDSFRVAFADARVETLPHDVNETVLRAGIIGKQQE